VRTIYLAMTLASVSRVACEVMWALYLVLVLSPCANHLT